MTEQAYYTPEQLAALFEVPVRTLENWRWHRRGPRWVKLGGHLVRYPATEVERYEREQMQPQEATHRRAVIGQSGE